MHPDLDLVKHAGSVVTHTLGSERGEYATYLDGNGPTELVLNLPAGEYSVSWVDVVSGEKTDAGTFRHSGGERTLKSPVFKSGIGLRISRRQESR
jgi:hypothetical protein